MNEQKIINNALRYIIDILDPINHYPYHNINHTLDVYARVGYLSDKEGIKQEDKTDLLMAALFHDTGFIQQYTDNESISVEIANKYLQSINYNVERIKKIERLILSTILFSKTNDILEGIIQDADLDNLGRNDCFIKTLLIRKEITSIGKMGMPKQKWLDFAYNLIGSYQYKTLTAQRERNIIQNLNLKKLEDKKEFFYDFFIF